MIDPGLVVFVERDMKGASSWSDVRMGESSLISSMELGWRP